MTPRMPIIQYPVTWDSYYDRKNVKTDHVTCSNLSRRYPYFKDFPHFPYIGGAYNVKWGSPYCGTCWNLTNLKTKRTISIAVIDHTYNGYNISKEAFNVLNGGKLGGRTLLAEAKQVAPHYCGFKDKK